MKYTIRKNSPIDYTLKTLKVTGAIIAIICCIAGATLFLHEAGILK